MKGMQFCFFVLTILLGFSLQAQPPASTTVVLSRARVIDGTGAAPLADATVVVRDGKIERVATGPLAEAPAGATLIDLQGKFLLPGLIDAHVHIANLRQASAALRSGVTTVRSMGVSNFTDVGIRELARAGAVEAPEFLACGYHVRPSLSEEFFFNEPALSELMAGIRGPENYRRAVTANLKHKPDWIKVTATERAGLPETDPRKQIMSEEELAAIVDESRKAGIPVAAHAHGDEGAMAAVRAGVRSIEHGTYLSDATLALMKEKGAYLVPTVAVVGDLMEPGGNYDDVRLQVRGRHMYPRLCEVVRKANQLGIKIVAATDSGYGPQSTLRLQHEIEELVRCGLTPVAAIEAATSTAAGLLSIEKRTGSIKAGLEADLIVVERNPLEDIVALQDVLLVVSNGRVILNRLSWSLPPSSS